jgi:hypothetical protein
MKPLDHDVCLAIHFFELVILQEIENEPYIVNKIQSMVKEFNIGR